MNFMARKSLFIHTLKNISEVRSTINSIEHEKKNNKLLNRQIT